MILCLMVLIDINWTNGTLQCHMLKMSHVENDTRSNGTVKWYVF